MKDALPVISLVIAVAAFTINGLTFRDRRRQDRRDLFLKMHERLIDPDLQEGRRLLHARVHSETHAARLRTHETDVYQKINRSLAMFDVFAMYVERGFIDKSVALEEWGHSLARAYEKAQPFMADRNKSQTWQPWPHFRRLGPEAVEWHRQQVDVSKGVN